ncbi:Retrovirus-related Pol polyprotein from transposon RE2 [Linum perenne]
MSVRLPDGGLIPVTHVGTVHFDCGLVLNHVLVIPSFKFNLMSISRIVEHGFYTASFSSSSCVFQDTKSFRKIGTVELSNGLYWFRQLDQNIPDKVCVSRCSTSFFNLWHFRLGHSSLDSLCKSLVSKVQNNFHCRVRPLAKQHKLKFPCSTSHANEVFDLIHVDIWGPYSVPTIDGHRYFLTIVDDCSRFTWVGLCVLNLMLESYCKIYAL